MRTISQYVLLLLLAVLAVTVLLSNVINAKKSDDKDDDEDKTMASAIISKQKKKSSERKSSSKSSHKNCNKKAQEIIQLYKCRNNVRRLLRLKGKCERAIKALTDKKKEQEAKQLNDKCYHGTLKLRLRINRICSKRYKCKFAIRSLSRLGVECRKWDVQVEEARKKGDKATAAEKKTLEELLQKQDTCNKQRRALKGKIRRNCSRHIKCFRAKIEARKICNDTKHVDKKNKKEDQGLRRVIRRCKRAVTRAKHRCSSSEKRVAEKPVHKEDKEKFKHAKHIVKLARRQVRRIRHEASKTKDIAAKKKLMRKLEAARISLVDAERKLRKYDSYTHNCQVAAKKVRRKARHCKKWRKRINETDEKKKPTAAQKKFYEERLSMCIEVLREYRENEYRVCGDRCKKLTTVTKSKACTMAINSWKQSNTVIMSLQKGVLSAKDDKAKLAVEENLRREKRTRFDAGRRMRCYCKATTRQCEVARYQFRNTMNKCRQTQDLINQDAEASDSSSGGFFFGLFGGGSSSTAKSIPKNKKASVLKQQRSCPEQIRHYRRKVENACAAKCKATSPEMKAYKCKHALSLNKGIIKKCQTIRASWKITKDASAKKALLNSLRDCRAKRARSSQNIDCYCKFTCDDALTRFNQLQSRLNALIDQSVLLERSNKKKNRTELQHLHNSAQRVARLRTNLAYKLATKCKSNIIDIPKVGLQL